ncbi:MAG TPA: cell wall hydrolase [Pseudolabrys sp.]|nr:cell wall hydrolase [Pseudolabrys sp.]
MAVLCKRRRAVGLGALLFGLVPSTAGFQDLGALLVQQPGVAARAFAHVIASPFGTIHAATFSMPDPVGTAIPHPPVYALANFDPGDVAASIASQFLGDPNAPLQFPKVNRRDKHDSFLARSRAPLPPLPAAMSIDVMPRVQADAPLKVEETSRFDPYTEYQFAAVPNEEGSRVFFGASPLTAGQEQIAPWASGEAPIVTAAVDPDIKQSALAPERPAGKAGESIAAKGEVTGADQRPKSPAERLGLSGPTRAKAEKCLANAVYFESRDEPVRAQIAVAQVVMNRVFSPFYPNDVCGVVYQNAGRHLACQFTFACNGVPAVVTEPDAWARAQHIARDMLDGRLWMPEVAKSTHYHDYWAHPNWVGEMRRMDRLGGLIFYRPRAWGDGAAEPKWGDAKTTAEEVKKM